MITDGKPSCIREGGKLYKNPFGLDLKIVNRTLEEAEKLRRDGIQLTTFMIATDEALVDFVDTMTKIARGRASSLPHRPRDVRVPGLHPEQEEALPVTLVLAAGAVGTSFARDRWLCSHDQTDRQTEREHFLRRVRGGRSHRHAVPPGFLPSSPSKKSPGAIPAPCPPRRPASRGKGSGEDRALTHSKKSSGSRRTSACRAGGVSSEARSSASPTTSGDVVEFVVSPGHAWEWRQALGEWAAARGRIAGAAAVRPDPAGTESPGPRVARAGASSRGGGSRRRASAASGA